MRLGKKLSPLLVVLASLTACVPKKTPETQITTAVKYYEPFYIIGKPVGRILQRKDENGLEYFFMINDKEFRCYDDAEQMAELLENVDTIKIMLPRYDPEAKKYLITLDNIVSFEQKYPK